MADLFTIHKDLNTNGYINLIEVRNHSKGDKYVLIAKKYTTKDHEIIHLRRLEYIELKPLSYTKDAPVYMKKANLVYDHIGGMKTYFFGRNNPNKNVKIVLVKHRNLKHLNEVRHDKSRIWINPRIGNDIFYHVLEINPGEEYQAWDDDKNKSVLFSFESLIPD